MQAQQRLEAELARVQSRLLAIEADSRAAADALAAVPRYAARSRAVEECHGVLNALVS